MTNQPPPSPPPITPSHRDRLARHRHQIEAFTRRYVHQIARSKLSLLFLMAWPTLWYLVITAILLPQATDGPVGPGVLKAVYGIGFGLFGALTVALNGFVGSLSADIMNKRYRKLRSLPLSPWADFTGRFASGYLFGTISFLSVLAVATVHGAAFTVHLPGAIAGVAAGLLAFTLAGMVTGLAVVLAVPRVEYATTIATTLLLVAFFATGLNGVSPALFPGPPWVLDYLPNTLPTRLMLAYLTTPDAGLSALTIPTRAAWLGVGLYTATGFWLGGWLLQAAVYRGELGE